MASIAKAFLFSSVSQYISSALAIVSAVIFSRLLTPAELGVYAIASAISLVVSEFKLLGTSKFLIREKMIDEEKVKSGIGLTMIACWGIGFGILIFSIPVSHGYGIEDIAGILQIGAINFFMAPFISVSSAVLARELNYHRIMSIRVYAQFFGFAVSLLLVQLGLSYWSLAWGMVASTAIEFLLFYVHKPPLVVWKPGLKYIKSIAKLGLYSSVTGILQRLGENATDLIVGKLGTTYDVAIVSRANGLHSFIRQIVVQGFEPVSLPHLTKVLREDGDVKSAYIKSISIIGVFFWPTLIVTGYFSKIAILLLFGKQWLEAIPIAMILTICFFFRSLHMFAPAVLITSFNEKIMMFRQFVIFAITVVVTVIAYPNGLEILAWGLVLVGFADFLLNVYCLKVAIGLGFLEFIKGIQKSLFVSLFCLLYAFALDYFFDVRNMQIMPAFCFLLFAMPLGLGVAILLLRHEVKDLAIKLISSR